MEWLLYLAIGYLCGTASTYIIERKKILKAPDEIRDVMDNKQKEKHCSNCKYNDAVFDEEPCNTCSTILNKWEAM